MTALNTYEIIRRVILTEKTSANEGVNLLAFEVDRRADKLQIKNAVEKAFSVRVLNVNTLNGKPTKVRFKGVAGKRGAVKKAYVTLHQDDTIDIFTKIQSK